MRAFFAVDLPDDLAEPIANVQAAFDGAAGLTHVDPEQAHVTLKFLGDIDAESDESLGDDEGPGTDEATPTLDDVVAVAERSVERADIEPFTCSIAGLGVFPSLDYVSVVWAGVEERARELTGLHETLEAETTALGIDTEDHEFTPHVTLARMNDARGKELVQDVVRERDPEIGRFTAEEVRLLQSTLTSEGPVYETVASFQLG